MPVVAHTLADPEKGSGIAMICTFGDLTDVTWWRELQLPTRPIIGWDGRILPDVPEWITTDAGRENYALIAGATSHTAKERMVEILTTSGDLVGEPKPITHPVKFYEKGDKPLEIVTTRQWYITNGGREPGLRAELIERGRELNWHPPHMQVRYENWVDGLNGDWLISRQRFFGVPLPLWYPLDEAGMPVYDSPIVPAEDTLPIDPSSDVPPGYAADQRGEAGRLHGRPRRHGHVGHQLADPADRRRLGARPRPVVARLPDGPAPAGARDHPHLAVLVGRARAPRGPLPAVGARRHLRAGSSTPTARR